MVVPLACSSFSYRSNSQQPHGLLLCFRSSAENCSDQVREAVAQNLGLMACICSLANVGTTEGDLSTPTLEEFACPQCDGQGTAITIVQVAGCEKIKLAPLLLWQPMFTKLLLKEASERVQVSCALI